MLSVGAVLKNNISRGSVATLSCGRICNDYCIPNFLFSVSVKEFLKIGQFFDSRCNVAFNVQLTLFSSFLLLYTDIPVFHNVIYDDDDVSAVTSRTSLIDAISPELRIRTPDCFTRLLYGEYL